METKKNGSALLDRIDLYSILRDVLRNLWAIILGAVAVAMIVNMITHSRAENTYSTKATFVITSRTTGNYAYNNLSAASTMAESFYNILNSSLLEKKVCRDLGVSSFDAKMSAAVVKDTNLLTLSVTSDTPWNAYRITRSVMKNMSELTVHVSSDMVMEVLQDPAVPTRPDLTSAVTRGQMVKAAVISGLVLSLAFAYLSFRKDTVKNEADLVDKLDADNLGLMYNRGARTFRELFEKKKRKLLITEPTAGFEFVERFKKIAAQITARADKEGAKVFVVTSVREHEGKSTVSANLALSLAGRSDRVLLIDGDLRRPTLHSIFADNAEGAAVPSDVLENVGEYRKYVFHDEKRGVDMLLSCRNYSNSTDLISSEAMAQLIEAARRDHDYVVIDTPPMSLMADAEVLAGLGDMSILVVGYDNVPAEDINDAIDTLRECRAKFAGCILNRVKTLPGEKRTVVGYGGYGRYGRYGRYGKYGRYGRYGNYGNYGTYGTYGHYGEHSDSER